jgi:hypothetical protein
LSKKSPDRSTGRGVNGRVLWRIATIARNAATVMRFDRGFKVRKEARASELVNAHGGHSADEHSAGKCHLGAFSFGGGSSGAGESHCCEPRGASDCTGNGVVQQAACALHEECVRCRRVGARLQVPRRRKRRHGFVGQCAMQRVACVRASRVTCCNDSRVLIRRATVRSLTGVLTTRVLIRVCLRSL